MIGLLAALNYGWRYPVPSATDVSHILNRGEATGAQQQIWGRAQDMPRLTRSGKGQVWLKTDQIRSLRENGAPLGPPEPVTGKLYVTLPAEEIDEVYPGQLLTLQGKLYKPSIPKNPNAFNFRQYLADNYSFAGFSGKWISDKGKEPSPWALWRLRQRIATAQEMGLGSPKGPLISAMALGRKAVNVPYDIQDAFIQAGLAHTLAASGFHVSLVLGVVLGIMSHPAVGGWFANPALAKVIAGGSALIGYVLLTGGQPSVLRASLMGAGALAGLALDRKVKPLGCLLLAVTLLLLWNPIWIDSLGFRLSVFATLGLIVSVKPLTDWLEWLPTTLATVMAVPVAAYFWTIPLSLFYFNTLTTYSILLNMAVTPLVAVLSLGGILTGLIAAFSPGIGAMLAWLLWLPAHLLIGLVNWEVSLPGSSVATGHIGLWQLFGLYGLYFLGWGHRWFRRRRWLVGLLLLLIAMGPLWYSSVARAEVTVLAAGNDAVLVARDSQSSLLVNSGTDRTGFYTVVPFLRQAGINRLTHAVNWVDSDGENWEAVTEKTPIQDFWQTRSTELVLTHAKQVHALVPGHPETLGAQELECLNADGTVCRLTLMGRHTWLMVAGLTQERERMLLEYARLKSEVLWWDGKALSEEWIAAVGAEVAIASAQSIDPDTQQRLLQHGTRVYCTEQDGAITWNPQQGYRAYLHQSHRSTVSFE
jgi:competence protein ComEC